MKFIWLKFAFASFVPKHKINSTMYKWCLKFSIILHIFTATSSSRLLWESLSHYAQMETFLSSSFLLHFVKLFYFSRLIFYCTGRKMWRNSLIFNTLRFKEHENNYYANPLDTHLERYRSIFAFKNKKKNIVRENYVNQNMHFISSTNVISLQRWIIHIRMSWNSIYSIV